MTDWEAHYRAREAAAAKEDLDRYLYPSRTPLTASQHILHLLLTVFTAGLWLPVWIILAIRGNRH